VGGRRRGPVAAGPAVGSIPPSGGATVGLNRPGGPSVGPRAVADEVVRVMSSASPAIACLATWVPCTSVGAPLDRRHERSRPRRRVTHPALTSSLRPVAREKAIGRVHTCRFP
jgi:hypothetical protein